MLSQSLLLLSLACAGVAPLGPFTAQVPPPGTGRPADPSSLEDLVAVSLAALNDRDTSALSRLAVGREEFLGAYPGFAVDTTAARRDFSVGFFLTDNRKLMLRSLSGEGGRGLALSRFTVDGPVEKYGNVTLFRGLRLWVRRGQAGEAAVSGEDELRFLKSAAKTPSGWRIWSFSDD